jgi:HlyD family secretion protein
VTTQSTASTVPVADKQRAASPGRGRSGWWKIPAGLVLVGGLIGGGVWYFKTAHAKQTKREAQAHDSASGESKGVPVEVVHPQPGGLEKISNMTGSVHPFEAADVYANVSGYLKSQETVVDGKTVMVDIGVHVKKGDLLAVIDVPEVFAAREQAEADREQAEAAVHQAIAQIETARADLAAAKAGVAEAEANVGRYKANKEMEFKAYERYRRLRAQSAVEQDVVDQKQDAHESAVAAEKGALAAVITATAKVTASKARVDNALADKKVAEANVAIARAKLKKAEVFVEYTKIRSPYTGVVTARNYFPGDFIRSASDGNTRPLFTVARTDLMRVVTKVSDLNVPYVDTGDPAEVTIQALPGEKFEGKVARFTESEIPNERTMITEVDIPNDEKSPARGRLRAGMYGMVKILLRPPSNHLTIPSSCLVGPAKDGENAALVVRDGKAVLTKVKVGADDGVRVEILSGLKPEDEVIIPTGSVADGTPVAPTSPQPKDEKPAHAA